MAGDSSGEAFVETAEVFSSRAEAAVRRVGAREGRAGGKFSGDPGGGMRLMDTSRSADLSWLHPCYQKRRLVAT
ncbi:MAG: hypothetical protein ACOYKZ_06985 [Chlamydiia bacterium]